ncbi:MAG: DMT family transporter [Acidobacteriota bacterium]|nr:DMT family transporter [Acidobacteriota bacterium]
MDQRGPELTLSGLQASRISLPPLPAVLLGMVSVQGGAALAKGLFPVLGPVGTVSLRIALSALILTLVYRPSFGSFGPQQWRAVVPYGVVLGMMNLSFYLALARIPLGLAVTLEFTGPLAVAVFASRRVQDFLWILLAATGIALIAPWSAGSNVDGHGVLLALVAGVCWALYIVLGARVSRLFASGAGVATGMWFATLAILPVTLGTHSLTHVNSKLLIAGLGVAILSSALPYSLEMIGLRAMPARTFGILMSVEPAIGALSGMVFLRERLSLQQWLAVLLVISASAGSTLTTRKRDIAPEA